MKVVWIEKKRNPKDNLKVSVNLDWGVAEFRLLSLHFSVDLTKMPELNYSVAINKINSIIRLWKSRNVTPIGKITIIKSLLFPQFNHFFMSIITPPEVLDTINKIFFVFMG